MLTISELTVLPFANRIFKTRSCLTLSPPPSLEDKNNQIGIGLGVS